MSTGRLPGIDADEVIECFWGLDVDLRDSVIRELAEKPSVLARSGKTSTY